MNKNQRLSDFYTLASANREKIIKEVDIAWDKVKSKGEVNRVRDFLIGDNQGVRHLNLTLPSLFLASGYELKFAGIMVHGKPIVMPLDRFDPPRLKTGLSANPELGDLNCIFLYLDDKKKVQHARAILYQAKLKRHSAISAIAQDHQMFLYDRAEGFQYSNGKFGGQNRRLPVAATRRRGLQYLFVSEKPVTCSAAPSDMPAFVDWSESFVRFLTDSEGLAISKGTPAGTGWSRIQHDLVEIFRDDQLLKTSSFSTLASWFNDFKNPDHWHATAHKETIGVPTLLAIVKDTHLKALSQNSEGPKLPRLK